MKIDAHGKHLFYEWEADRCLHIHLGLYGKFRNHKTPPPDPRGAVRLRVVGDSHAFDLNGPTACELIDTEQQACIHARLGQDPLRPDADFEAVWKRVQRSRAAIGTLLLNQAVFAGVGNVYRAEVLFDAGVDPRRRGNQLSREECEWIWDRLVEWLAVGVKYNRIITAEPPEGKPRSRMKQEERLMCYKKQLCTWCESPVSRWDLGGRSMYACLECQT